MSQDAHAGNVAAAPLNFDRHSRACTGCRLVKTFEQFVAHGCENCVHLLMKDDRERVVDLTTPNYTGLVSLLQGQSSWVGKWLRLDKYVTGCYALELDGTAAVN